jgi:hypothetical protein
MESILKYIRIAGIVSQDALRIVHFEELDLELGINEGHVCSISNASVE